MDNNIINVCGYEIVKVFPESLINKPLECYRTTRKAKEGDKLFKEAISCLKHGLPFLSSCNATPVEGRDNIKLRKPSSARYIPESLLN